MIKLLSKVLLFGMISMHANDVVSLTQKNEFDFWVQSGKKLLIVVTAQGCMQCKHILRWIENHTSEEVYCLAIDLGTLNHLMQVG